MKLKKSDALLIVDPQVDFVSGALPVPGAIEIREPLMRIYKRFAEADAYIFVSLDYHPNNHCSFAEYGGRWPKHCVAGTPGAGIAFHLPYYNPIRKGADSKKEAYSAFDSANLSPWLKECKIKRLFVCGLATEYCVRSTVLDALDRGYQVNIIPEAMRGIGAEAVAHALYDMIALGAATMSVDEVCG